MTATFTADLSTAISRVRQMLGDTDITSAAVQDETITAYLASRSEAQAAAQLAKDLAARYAAKIDNTVDGASVRYSQLYDHYKLLAADLAKTAAAEAAPATVGGFAGIGVFGATSAEVVADRCDSDAATNAPLRWA